MTPATGLELQLFPHRGLDHARVRRAGRGSFSLLHVSGISHARQAPRVPSNTPASPGCAQRRLAPPPRRDSGRPPLCRCPLSPRPCSQWRPRGPGDCLPQGRDPGVHARAEVSPVPHPSAPAAPARLGARVGVTAPRLSAPARELPEAPRSRGFELNRNRRGRLTE